MSRARLAGGVATLVAGAVLAGCSSPSAAPLVPTTQQTTSAATTQWWSGSDYCAILRQTIRAGHSALSGAKAGDPALLATTKAFVSDLIAAAPAPVSAQWQVFGPALTDLIGSGGKPTAMSGANNRRVAAAAAAIATDAKSRCHVDVST